jgi:hypothetical protein
MDMILALWRAHFRTVYLLSQNEGWMSVSCEIDASLRLSHIPHADLERPLHRAAQLWYARCVVGVDDDTLLRMAWRSKRKP